MRIEQRSKTRPWYVALPFVTVLVLLGVWWATTAADLFPVGTVPSPGEVLRGFRGELVSGRLLDDATATMFRVAVGFTLAAALAVPLGLMLGNVPWLRAALLPTVNFFRSLSPIAWIPFAVVWFGISDPPAVFIIFMATFFQMVLATTAAVAAVPSVYYRVAEDHGIRGVRLLGTVTLPAIMPELITALRIGVGVAWMVVVAAEMLGVQSGLGFLILDSRNALRPDLVVVGMITIGVIGVALDRVLAQLTKLRGVRWGYDR